MNIAIAGYGSEGKSSYRYYSQLGHEVTIFDENENLTVPEGVVAHRGAGVLGDITGYDLVIRAPGINPKKIHTDAKIWSSTNEFFAKCPAPIIGVTGTKGKGTTASLIASALTSAGHTVHLVGNIGVPALDVLPQIGPGDVVVYELSSFQLWDLEKSPHIAVVLMIEPDHLEVHDDFTQYIHAKANIVAHQSPNDIVIHHPSNEFSLMIASKGVGIKQPYGVPGGDGVYVQENTFFIHDEAVAQLDDLQLAGMHNVENACAALSAVHAFTGTATGMREGLQNFAGLPHRLRFVREVRGVRYYDDSIATTPGSAIAALRSFTEPITILLGGSDKGADYTELVHRACDENATIIAMGATGEKIFQLAKTIYQNHEKIAYVPGDMKEVVQEASRRAGPGSVVVLSPASASFDRYTSYSERGDRFIAEVEAL